MSRQSDEANEQRSNRHLAKILGISYDEISQYSPEIRENTGNHDETVYSYTVIFPEDTPKSILKKVDGINGFEVELTPGDFDEGESEEFEDFEGVSKLSIRETTYDELLSAVTGNPVSEDFFFKLLTSFLEDGKKIVLTDKEGQAIKGLWIDKSTQKILKINLG